MLHPPFVLDPAPPSATPERLALAHARAMLRRLSRFALCWLLTSALWKAVLVVENVFSPALAAVALVMEAAALAAAGRIARSSPEHTAYVLIAAAVSLASAWGISLAVAHGDADLLAFVLLTLYLACALFFAWGWRAELAVVSVTALGWVAAAPFLRFDVPPLELAAAIGIGAALSVAIAEASARSFRLAYLHWTSERRGRDALEISRDEAERARRDAEQSRDEAEQARLDAERARDEAENARGEAESATRAKDRFLASVSHELRGPLAAVLSWTELARREVPEGGRLAHALGVIERNTRAQARLIEDLLDVSRIVSGKLKIEVADVDVDAVIAAVADAIHPACDAKGIALHLSAAHLACRVRGDAARLRQVLENVVSNAIKFTPEHGDVWVTAEADGGMYELAVRDTGCGIDVAHLPHVFDAFEQADPAIARRHAGLGLGLSIAKHLVEAHGGTISAESAGPGTGALFRIRLPCASVAGRAAASPLRGAAGALS